MGYPFGFREEPVGVPLDPPNLSGMGTSPAGLSRGLGTHHHEVYGVPETLSGGTAGSALKGDFILLLYDLLGPKSISTPCW